MPHNQPLLIVEDDFLISATIERTASKCGFVVVGKAVNLEQAVAVCEQEKPAFATMDIKLAGPENGLQVAAILEERFGVPSLFVSAFDDDREIALKDLRHPLGWLSKPFTGSALSRALEDAALRLA